MKERKYIIISVITVDVPVYWTGKRWTEYRTQARQYTDVGTLCADIQSVMLGSVTTCIPADLDNHGTFEVLRAMGETALIVERYLP